MKWQDVLVAELRVLIDRAILDAYPRFLLKKGLEMTLDEVRKLKKEIQRDLKSRQIELVDLEEEEKRIRKAPPKPDEMQEYIRRMSGLLDGVDDGSDFRISFRKDGEANRTNLLPPGKDDEVLRRLARSMLIERVVRRTERAGGVVLFEV